MVVIGQVAADKEAHYAGLYGKLLKEVDLAKRVLSLPERVDGKILGAGTGLEPVEQAGHVVKISISAEESNGFFKKKRIVRDSAERPLKGDVHIVLFRNFFGRNRIVLYKDNKPVCLAVQDTKEVLRAAYFVFGPTPLSGSEKLMYKQDGIPFFRWGHVVDKDAEMQISFPAVRIWNEERFVSLFNVLESKQDTKTSKQAASNASKPSERYLVDPSDDQIFCVALKQGKKKSDGSKLVIPPGADPVFGIMATVIVDTF